MKAKLAIKTPLLTTCAIGLVFIFRRPDIYLNMDRVSEAFHENIVSAKSRK